MKHENRKPQGVEEPLAAVLGTAKSIKGKCAYLTDQVEHIQYIIAAFHPDPVLRKFANAQLKEAVEFLDPKLYDERFQGTRTAYPSSDTLFIAEVVIDNCGPPYVYEAVSR